MAEDSAQRDPASGIACYDDPDTACRLFFKDGEEIAWHYGSVALGHSPVLCYRPDVYHDDLNFARGPWREGEFRGDIAALPLRLAIQRARQEGAP